MNLLFSVQCEVVVSPSHGLLRVLHREDCLQGFPRFLLRLGGVIAPPSQAACFDFLIGLQLEVACLGGVNAPPSQAAWFDFLIGLQLEGTLAEDSAIGVLLRMWGRFVAAVFLLLLEGGELLDPRIRSSVAP